MNTTGTLSDRRLREHDYSAPGTYHLLLETDGGTATLGTKDNGVMRLNEYGEVFLSVLGMALQTFACVRIDGMDIRPRCVDLAVTITAHRKGLRALFKTYRDRWHYRRTMTLSVFVGYVKMNSARRINALRGVSGESFWTERYKARVLTDQAEIDRLCGKLESRFQRIRFSCRPESGAENAVTLSSALTSAFRALFNDASVMSGMIEAPEQPYDTLLLGRALFLSGSMLRPPTTDDGDNEDSEQSRVPGGRTRIPLIWSIGPGRIFLSIPPVN